MTQEEKQLLLKDLCGRLPYGVVIHTWYNGSIDIKCTGIDLYANTINLDISKDDDAKVYIDNVKPYLRPMSSMTYDESKDYDILIQYDAYHPVNTDLYDWFNAHYLDYRGLISMGLALEASEWMYKTE